MGRLRAEDDDTPPTPTLRHRVWQELDIRETRSHGPSVSNVIIMILIVASVTLAIIGTEPSIHVPYGDWLLMAERSFGVVFVVEYVLRVWCMGERVEFQGWRGRLRYMMRPVALFDLLALLPFLALFGGDDFLFLRVVRLARILALGRLGEFSTAFQRLYHALVGRAADLGIAAVCAGLLMLVAATMLYIVEREVQPEAFGSIPRALWWAVATLTTVGYGDVYPVTALGRVFAGLTALAGIGIIGLPAGIMAAAFSDALAEHREEARRRRQTKPGSKP